MKTLAGIRVKNRHFQDASRGNGKKSRTRALILDTAIEILAEKGIERTSILELAERAGLSNASFYYHFRNKDELIDAVGGAVASTLVREVDEAITGVEQGTRRVALATMLFIERGVADPAWGGLIVHALVDLGEFREQIFSGIQKDVRIGIAQKRFDIADVPATYSMLLAMVGAAMRERLSDANATDIALNTAQAILRVLGTGPAEANRIAVEASKQIDQGLGEVR
jgi:AcrR family transcriptional regulator